MKKFSPQTIVFLSDAITGGPNVPNSKNPWPYRAGWQIVRFFKECGYKFEFGQASRVPWAEERLEEINEKEGTRGLAKIINRLVDPRDWFGKIELLKKLVIALNKFLFYDGYEIFFKKSEKKFLLRERGSMSPIIEEVLKKDFFNIESINKDFKRSLASTSTDPADSITSSCSFVESVCKHILDKTGRDYPRKQTINSLVKEVLKILSLLPENAEDEDFKKLLGSLGNIAQTVGAIRTKEGDAHGRAIDSSAINSLHAKLVIGAASALSLFLVEVFESQDSFKKVKTKKVKKLVEEYHEAILDKSNPHEPLPYKYCPKCGNDKLERYSIPPQEHESGPMFFIKCKNCKWEEAE